MKTLISGGIKIEALVLTTCNFEVPSKDSLLSAPFFEAVQLQFLLLKLIFFLKKLNQKT